MKTAKTVRLCDYTYACEAQIITGQFKTCKSQSSDATLRLTNEQNIQNQVSDAPISVSFSISI